MSKPIVCKNCDFEYEGKFCPQCGQKAKTKRITMKQVFNDARQHFIHFDQGFLYTIKALLLRPGHAVREYLEGKRVKHIRPVKFMFWSAAISFLVFHFIGLDKDMLEKIEQQQQSANNQLSQRFAEKVFGLFSDHPAITLFIMIPLIAFWSWLLFRRFRYNYAEHFVLNAYLMGEISLASIVISPLSKLIGKMTTSTWPMTLFAVVIWAGYFGWSYRQFFQSKTFGVWVKGCLSILIGYFSMILVIGLMVATFIILFRDRLEAWLMAS